MMVRKRSNGGFQTRPMKKVRKTHTDNGKDYAVLELHRNRFLMNRSSRLIKHNNPWILNV